MSCQVDRQALEGNFSIPPTKVLLIPLFKTSSVDERSLEDHRNFPKLARVRTWIRNTARDLKVWTTSLKQKTLLMVEMGIPELKRLQKFCAGRVPVILHPFLYRALKLTYATNFDSIVLDGYRTSGLETGSLG